MVSGHVFSVKFTQSPNVEASPVGKSHHSAHSDRLEERRVTQTDRGEAASCEGFGVRPGEAQDMKLDDEADVGEGRGDRNRKGPNYGCVKPDPLKILITKAEHFPWI